MPCKNYFLNLSRTGGVSVNYFRLPTGAGMHTAADSSTPFTNCWLKKLNFYSSTTGRQQIQISPHPITKAKHPQELYKHHNHLPFNSLNLIFQGLDHPPNFFFMGLVISIVLLLQLH